MSSFTTFALSKEQNLKQLVYNNQVKVHHAPSHLIQSNFIDMSMRSRTQTETPTHYTGTIWHVWVTPLCSISWQKWIGRGVINSITIWIVARLIGSFHFNQMFQIRAKKILIKSVYLFNESYPAWIQINQNPKASIERWGRDQ